MNYISDYLTKILKNWIFILCILPTLYDLIAAYTGGIYLYGLNLSELRLPNSVSSLMFLAGFLVSNYLVWLDEKKYNIQLNEENEKLKSNAVSYELSFHKSHINFKYFFDIIEKELLWIDETRNRIDPPQSTHNVKVEDLNINIEGMAALKQVINDIEKTKIPQFVEAKYSKEEKQDIINKYEEDINNIQKNLKIFSEKFELMTPFS